MTEPIDFPVIRLRGEDVPLKFRTSDVIRLKLESGIDIFRIPTGLVNAEAWDMVCKIISHGVRHRMLITPLQVADELDFVNDRERFAQADVAVTEALKKVWAQARPKPVATATETAA